jgi:hypothetical protein
LRDKRRVRAFENGVLRKILDLKREKFKDEWRRLLNEELQDLYYPLNIIRVITSRKMRWAEHVAHKGVEKFLRCFDWEI